MSVEEVVGIISAWNMRVVGVSRRVRMAVSMSAGVIAGNSGTCVGGKFVSNSRYTWHGDYGTV